MFLLVRYLETFDSLGLNKEGASTRTETSDYVFNSRKDSGENFICF